MRLPSLSGFLLVIISMVFAIGTFWLVITQLVRGNLAIIFYVLGAWSILFVFSVSISKPKKTVRRPETKRESKQEQVIVEEPVKAPDRVPQID